MNSSNDYLRFCVQVLQRAETVCYYYFFFYMCSLLLYAEANSRHWQLVGEEVYERRTVSCLRVHVIMSTLRYADNIPKWIATKIFFFILLILVITGFISIALFPIYVHSTASKLFGSINYYRMLRKIEELQYAKEGTLYDFLLPSPREKSQETVLWWHMFNDWFTNKETQICWAHPYLWFKSSYCDWL